MIKRCELPVPPSSLLPNFNVIPFQQNLPDMTHLPNTPPRHPPTHLPDTPRHTSPRNSEYFTHFSHPAALLYLIKQKKLPAFQICSLYIMNRHWFAIRHSFQGCHGGILKSHTSSSSASSASKPMLGTKVAKWKLFKLTEKTESRGF